MSTVATQLKLARENKGFSQNEVATILNITRQSISKWENGRTYPDIDNLVLLSKLYETSIDELVQSNEKLQKQINENKQEIEAKRNTLKNINTELYQNRDEGIFLLVLSFVSAIIPPAGIFIPMYVMWRNTKYNSLYKTIYLVSVLIIIVSIWGSLIFINDNFLDPTQTKIYSVN